MANIFLQYVSGFETIYLRYGPNVVLADYNVKKEIGKNILFQNFIREKEKQAETRKLPFRHFLVLPVTRLQRYSLLLDAVYKRTPDDHPDKKDLATVTSTIVQVATNMDERTADSKQQLRLLQIHDQLQYKSAPSNGQQQQKSPQNLPQPSQQQPTVDDLQLLEPGRKLIYEGTVMKRSQLMESNPVHLLLFDHMLIITKPKRSTKQLSAALLSPALPPPLPSHANSTQPLNGLSAVNPPIDYNAYIISKNPIPLNLLHIQGTEGFALGDYTLQQSSSAPGTPSATDSPLSSPIPSKRFKSSPSSNPTPLTLQHIGRHGIEYTVYVDSPQLQIVWKEKIVEAKAQWDKAHLGRNVFGIKCLTDHTFGPSLSAGKILASAPFGQWKRKEWKRPKKADLIIQLVPAENEWLSPARHKDFGWEA